MNNVLVEHFGRWAHVRPATSMRATEDSMPEPGSMLVPKTDAPGPLPTRALLLVEIAVSSLRDGRLVKAPLYAKTESPEYWSVNVQAAQLELFRAPRDGVYQAHFGLGPSDTIRPVSFPDVDFPLSGFLVPPEPKH